MVQNNKLNACIKFEHGSLTIICISKNKSISKKVNGGCMDNDGNLDVINKILGFL